MVISASGDSSWYSSAIFTDTEQLGELDFDIIAFDQGTSLDLAEWVSVPFEPFADGFYSYSC
jgi:hypothetical protein